MQPTIFAGVALALVIAVCFARDRVRAVWWLFAFLLLFGATSVATLTALGGSSVTMPLFGLVVLFAVTALVVVPREATISRRVATIHILAISLIIYGWVITWFGPRLFAGTIDVVAMRPDVVDGVAVARPLEPRSGNVTQVLYMTASYLAAMTVSVLFARRLPARDFCNAILMAGALHGLFGLIDAIGLLFGQGRVLDFLRNASFLMVDQTVGTVPRLSGSLPEPSAYASAGVPFAVFAIELWVRTRNRAAGLVGFGLWIMILASTSSTGIFALSVYGLVGLPRFLLSKGRFALKIVSLLFVAFLALLGTFVALARPDVAAAIWDFVAGMTIRKGDSASGIERASWAAQGWAAFKASYGLGTGAGSFRSSSYAMAVIGSLGLIGATLALTYLIQIVQKTWSRRADASQKAAAWAALLTIAGSLLTGGSPDPGIVFGLLAGFALRSRAWAPRAERGAPEPAFETRNALA